MTGFPIVKSNTIFAVSFEGVGRDWGSPGKDGGDPAPSAGWASALVALASLEGIDLVVLDSSADVGMDV
jgi:hypothetical protein